MWKKIGFITALGIVGCLTALSVFAYGMLQRITVHARKNPTASPVIAMPKPKVNAFHNGEPYTLLLMGYGGGGHDGGLLTDSMLMAHIVPAQRAIFLISIPRDLWVPLESDVNASPTAHFKINAAYAIGSDDRGYPRKPEQFTGPAGGGEMAKSAVTTVTGMPIDNFVTLDFYGFTKSIDALGGVNVKVEKSFEDPFYPIEAKVNDPCGKSDDEIKQIDATLSGDLRDQQFTCRYEDLKFSRGITHMDGATALKYVRSRHSTQDGTDFGRAARQRNLLLAVKQRVFSLDFFPKIIPFISSLGNDVQMDLDLSTMEDFLQYKDDLGKYTVYTLALTNQNVLIETHSHDGQDVLMPKAGLDQWQSIQDWLSTQMQQDLLQPQNASGSASLSASPSAQVSF